MNDFEMIMANIQEQNAKNAEWGTASTSQLSDGTMLKNLSEEELMAELTEESILNSIGLNIQREGGY